MNRARRHGDPLAGGPAKPRAPLADRLWAKVAKAGPDDCWLWTAYIQSTGYGRLCVSYGRMVYAHRLAYELCVGPIPPGHHIDHLCRVRHCVNPAHLEAVTQAENNRRAHRAKRR